MEYRILITVIVRNICILQRKESKQFKIKYATKKISSPQLKLSWTPWPIEGATAEYPATGRNNNEIKLVFISGA